VLAWPYPVARKLVMKSIARAVVSSTLVLCALTPATSFAEEHFHLDVGNFSGIWEGRLRTTYPPEDDRQFDIRMAFTDDSPVFSLKTPDEDDYSEIGSCWGFRLQEDRYICNTESQGGVWTEVFSIDQVRLTETTAHLYVRRVVDNDLSQDIESDHDRHFSTSFDGELTMKWGQVDPPNN